MTDVMVSYHMGGKDVRKNGKYLGDEQYPGNGNTDMTKDPNYISWGTKGKNNPKIELEDGTVIWGCECWWWEI